MYKSLLILACAPPFAAHAEDFGEAMVQQVQERNAYAWQGVAQPQPGPVVDLGSRGFATPEGRITPMGGDTYMTPDGPVTVMTGPEYRP